MKELSKSSLAERDELLKAAQKAKDDLETGISEFNSEMQELYNDKIKSRVEALNEKLSALRTWCEELHSEAESYWDERSDKWKEGEKGEQYSSWKESFEDALRSLDDVEVDEVQEVDMPDVELTEVENIVASPEEM